MRYPYTVFAAIFLIAGSAIFYASRRKDRGAATVQPDTPASIDANGVSTFASPPASPAPAERVEATPPGPANGHDAESGKGVQPSKNRQEARAAERAPVETKTPIQRRPEPRSGGERDAGRGDASAGRGMSTDENPSEDGRQVWAGGPGGRGWRQNRFPARGNIVVRHFPNGGTVITYPGGASRYIPPGERRPGRRFPR